ncbi:MAG: glycosyltransferase family 2 protein [Chitinophagaceae bacterium]
MKISGLIIVRNAVLNDYPVVEAISSVLPMVDEMVVSIDVGDDNSEELIRSMNDPKIKIFYSTWDMSLRDGGKLYGVETNKAKEHVSPDSDWIFYIQADEIIHEKYQQVILETANKYCNNPKVQGLLFRYLHFYATYDYVGASRKWYNYEVRLIKNDKSIQSYKDAQGFRVGETKLRVVPVDAEVYHYGWVKSPEQMKRKMKNVFAYYNTNDNWVDTFMKSEDFFNFQDEYDSVARFTGTHPAVMKERIQNKNWDIQLDVSRKRFSLKDRILFFIEQKTGKRLFEFRNYRIIKP